MMIDASKNYDKKREKLEFYGHWLKLLSTFFVTENVYSESHSVRPKASHVAMPLAALRARGLWAL